MNHRSSNPTLRKQLQAPAPMAQLPPPPLHQNPQRIPRMVTDDKLHRDKKPTRTTVQ